MKSLNINIQNCRYQAMIGVGGIGSGVFFSLIGNHTLGREESRSGYFMDRKDYCKLHIIAHYVQNLMGNKFQVIPVGKIGNDEIGKKLLLEMKEVGLITDYIEQLPGSPTLFSFCFIYPDGSGGNMTTSDSACSKLDSDFIKKTEKEFEKYSGRGIALAAPEVSLKARETLLELGSNYKFFRAASFTSEEMKTVLQTGILKKVDLLAINYDEAAASIGESAEKEPISIIESSISVFAGENPFLIVSITKGKYGSWVWDGTKVTHLPAPDVMVESTAGAGDAFFSGLISGIAVGLSIKECQQLAALTAASSVTSPHTINKLTDKNSLREIANKYNNISNSVYKLLED